MSACADRPCAMHGLHHHRHGNHVTLCLLPTRSCPVRQVPHQPLQLGLRLPIPMLLLQVQRRRRGVRQLSLHAHAAPMRNQL